MAGLPHSQQQFRFANFNKIESIWISDSIQTQLKLNSRWNLIRRTRFIFECGKFIKLCVKLRRVPQGAPARSTTLNHITRQKFKRREALCRKMKIAWQPVWRKLIFCEAPFEVASDIKHLIALSASPRERRRHARTAPHKTADGAKRDSVASFQSAHKRWGPRLEKFCQNESSAAFFAFGAKGENSTNILPEMLGALFVPWRVQPCARGEKFKLKVRSGRKNRYCSKLPATTNFCRQTWSRSEKLISRSLFMRAALRRSTSGCSGGFFLTKPPADLGPRVVA